MKSFIASVFYRTSVSELVSFAANIVSILGIIFIYNEFKKTNVELKRQKDGLEVSVSKEGVVVLKNKLSENIEIIEVRQYREYLNTKNVYDGKNEPQLAFSKNFERMILRDYLDDFRSTGTYSGLTEKIIRERIKKLKKYNFLLKKSKKYIVEETIQWNDVYTLLDSKTNVKGKIEDYLAIFVKIWITYKHGDEVETKCFLLLNNTVISPTMNWLKFSTSTVK